jgi:hypothetical protein
MAKYFKIKITREAYMEYVLKAECKKDAEELAREEIEWADEQLEYDTDYDVKEISKDKAKNEDVYDLNFFGFMSQCDVD